MTEDRFVSFIASPAALASPVNGLGVLVGDIEEHRHFRCYMPEEKRNIF